MNQFVSGYINAGYRVLTVEVLARVVDSAEILYSYVYFSLYHQQRWFGK
jgi:hypothetical protein